MKGQTQAPPPQSRLEVKPYTRVVRTAIWEKRDWKTPPDRDWRIAIELAFVMLVCLQTRKNILISMNRVCNRDYKRVSIPV